VIPDSLLGLILFAASLGPGYVFETVAEKRRPRPTRSTLGETVGMAVIGASFSVLAAIVVLLVAHATSWLDPKALANETTLYVLRDPLRAPAALATVFVLGYAGAGATAHLIYPRKKGRIQPGAVPWHRVFLQERPDDDSSVFVTVHMRDGTKIAGALDSYTLEHGDNREIALVAPMAKQLKDATAEPLTEDFVVLREADVLYITGHYMTEAKLQNDP
jgi:hypothetical protein